MLNMGHNMIFGPQYVVWATIWGLGHQARQALPLSLAQILTPNLGWLRIIIITTLKEAQAVSRDVTPFLTLWCIALVRAVAS